MPGTALPLPFILHWGRQDSAVAFYGCKITPEDLQDVILRVPELGARIENYALHPYEDAGANKRLELWLELANGVTLEASPSLEAAALEELGRINQDFRESIRMVPEGCRPTLKLFPFGQSPISGQDIRIKRRYIV
jgi:phenylacetate-coenzyme A ligase PaaK-like adenylate-forming protein